MSQDLTTEPVQPLTETSEKSANSLSEKPSSMGLPPNLLTPLGDVREKPSTLWKPGQSGNPNGRPKGSKNKITLLKLSLEEYLREEASDHMGEILHTAIRMAKHGHPGMIKLLLELHMSKSGDVDDRHTDDKITININSMGENKEPPAINITPTKE